MSGDAIKYYVNTQTLSGTTIGDIDTDAKSMSVHTHCTANLKYSHLELWFWRDSAWHYYPTMQPCNTAGQEVEITYTYRQPATVHFSIYDPRGEFVRENRNSTFNYNAAGVYDPILDIRRKFLLRHGMHCYANLLSGLTAVSSIAPSASALSYLTDNGAADYSAGSFILPHAPAVFAVNNTTLTLDFDLGSVKFLRHALVRVGTKTQGGFVWTLPNQIQIWYSSDNVNWSPGPKRPVGGNGDATYTPGDYVDDYYGVAWEIKLCDLEASARYVRIAVSTNANITIAIDEICVYGGDSASFLGKNLLIGYLGDGTKLTANGFIDIQATDLTKKAKDNNACSKLTPPYYQTDAADIIANILTSGAFWRNVNEYSAPYVGGNIGWSTGVGLTGMTYPVWQGQTNNVLGYMYELAHSIGWILEPDGNEVWHLTEPVFGQRTADKFVGAGDDSNNDGRGFERVQTDQDMRNEVLVASGSAQETTPGSTTGREPNSIHRYGPAFTSINDPILLTATMRDKVADYFLRDYAWRLQTLNGKFNADYDLGLRKIYAIRAPYRANVFARSSSKNGDIRQIELWSLNSAVLRIGISEYEVNAVFIPYYPFATQSPTFSSFNTTNAVADLIPTWIWPTDPLVASLKLYISADSEFDGFNLVKVYTNPATVTDTFTTTYPLVAGGTLPIVIGDRYWAYLASADSEGNESLPSNELNVIAGSHVSGGTDCDSYGTGSGYVITDFAVSLAGAPTGPDAHGLYTYQFYATWTAPLCGHTQHRTRANPFALPSGDIDDTQSWAWSEQKWDWWAPDRIPQGRTWDYTTFAPLNFTFTFKTATLFTAGQKIYWRIWNSRRTRAWLPVASNYDFVTF